MSIIKKKNPQMGMEADMKEGKPSLAIAFSTAKHTKKKMAAGGEVMPADFMADDERAESIADAIMQKRKKMAKGGQVDLEANSEEDPNFYDDLNADAADAEQYDLGQISPQPEDSNEMGDDIDSDQHDMISRIRAKLRMKSGA